ncbi:hypothetical protein VCUG_01244 [Vavraia culicis subsp. floridensis]|uniref:Uncharacterized protein n=1 Tax=Vavraia culicis (isolate floridensis) TaxID=948595 RepID=L2GVC7_VAVCU|nr:uncharacterized protein VCUG_01244 [Vavraia culicis subsp. floridensis]ELA47248.1 hypothetical protein VCUG_01244 [Vavraia culicis subsp. floridensis]
MAINAVQLAFYVLFLRAIRYFDTDATIFLIDRRYAVKKEMLMPLIHTFDRFIRVCNAISIRKDILSMRMCCAIAYKQFLKIVCWKWRVCLLVLHGEAEMITFYTV